MKNRFVLFPALLFLMNSHTTNGQSFTVLTDTFYVTATHSFVMLQDSTVTGKGPVTFSWSVTDCNFPADWIGANYFSLCDNSYCRYLFSLWPAVGADSTFQYAAHDTGVLTMVMHLPDSASSGCYHLTVRLRDKNSYSDIGTETWMVCHQATLEASKTTVDDAYSLYPNPTNGELHLYSNVNSHVAKVEVYNMSGERLKVVACSNGVQTIALNDLSNGTYTARLIDDNGSTITIKKFIKD